MPLYKNYLKKKQNPPPENAEKHLDVSPKTIISPKNQTESLKNSKISLNDSITKKPNLPAFDDDIKRILDKYTKFTQKTSDTSDSLISSFDISSNFDFPILGNKQTGCHGNAVNESHSSTDSKESSISQKILKNCDRTQICKISSSVDDITEIVAKYSQSAKKLIIDDKNTTKSSQNESQNSSKSQLLMNSPRTKKAYLAFLETQNESSDEDVNEIVAKYSQIPENESPKNGKCDKNFESQNCKNSSQTSQKDSHVSSEKSQLAMNSPRTKKAYLDFLETQKDSSEEDIREIVAKYSQTPDISITEDESPENLKCDKNLRSRRNSKNTSQTSQKDSQGSSQKSQLSMNSPRTKKAYLDFLETQKDSSEEDIREIVAKYSQTHDISITEDESPENSKCDKNLRPRKNSKNASQTSQKDSQSSSQKSQLSMNSPRTKKAYLTFMETQKDSSEEDIREIVRKYAQTPDISIIEDESSKNSKCDKNLRPRQSSKNTSQKDSQSSSQKSQLSMNSPRTKKAYLTFMETQKDSSEEDIREIVRKYSQTPDISVIEDESPINSKCERNLRPRQNSKNTSQKDSQGSSQKPQLSMNSPRTKKAYLAFMESQKDSSEEDIREIVTKYSQTPDISIIEDESPINSKCERNLRPRQNSKNTSQKDSQGSSQKPQLSMNSPRTKKAYLAFMETQKDSSKEDIREIVTKYSQTPDISIIEDESPKNPESSKNLRQYQNSKKTLQKNSENSLQKSQPQDSKKISQTTQKDNQGSSQKSQLSMNSPRTKKAYLAFMKTRKDSSEEDIREIVAKYSQNPDISIIENENFNHSKCDKNSKKTSQKSSVSSLQKSMNNPRTKKDVKEIVAKYSLYPGLSITTNKTPKKTTHCTQRNYKRPTNPKKSSQKTQKTELKKSQPKKEYSAYVTIQKTPSEKKIKQKKANLQKPTQPSPNQTFEQEIRAIMEKYSQSSNSQNSQTNAKQAMLSIIENLDVSEDNTLDETRMSLNSQRSSIDTAIEDLSTLMSTQDLTQENSSKKRGKNLDRNNNKRRKTYNSQEEVDGFVVEVINSRNVGLYVICDKCEKMRYLENCVDPLDLPEVWFCNMHPDQRYNDCKKPDEKIDKEIESNLIENLYNAGSIVWAKIEGYPWWPAMVDDDPDYGVFYCLKDGSRKPNEYHVTLFGNNVYRAWIKPNRLIGFKKGLTKYKTVIKKFRKLHQKKLNAVIPQVKQACLMSLPERIKTFTFLVRYIKLQVERKEKIRQKKQERKGLTF